MEFAFTNGSQNRLAELFELCLTDDLIKAAAIHSLNINVCVAEEEVLFEVINGVEVLVAELAWIVVLELELEVLCCVWSAVLLVAVEFPHAGESFIAVLTRHII